MKQKITITVELSESGHSANIYSKECRSEFSVHSGALPIALASLVNEWLQQIEADEGKSFPPDPLCRTNMRLQQWESVKRDRA